MTASRRWTVGLTAIAFAVGLTGCGSTHASTPTSGPTSKRTSDSPQTDAADACVMWKRANANLVFGDSTGSWESEAIYAEDYGDQATSSPEWVPLNRDIREWFLAATSHQSVTGFYLTIADQCLKVPTSVLMHTQAVLSG